MIIVEPLKEPLVEMSIKNEPQMKSRSRQNQGGFTLIEVLVAMVVLGFALLGLFSLHSVALSASRQSEKMGICAMLAKSQMEYLMNLSYPADGSAAPTDLVDLAPDPTTATTPFVPLNHPNGGSMPDAINAAGTTDAADGPLLYYRTWDVEYPFTDTSVIELTVRVTYIDGITDNAKTHGMTITSYRFQDMP